MERYKNKWFRLTLEKDLKNEALGVNLHCKEDGMYITVPPYPTTGDKLREDYDTQILVERINKFVKDYQVRVNLEEALYGDNIKIKLKVENA